MWARVLKDGSKRRYFTVYLCAKNKLSAYYSKDEYLTEDLKIPNESLNKVTCQRLLKISLIPGKRTCKVGWRYFISLRSFKHDIRFPVQTVKGIFQR